jgi:hypothetical protein
VSERSEWFVYRVDGPPIGPLSTQAVAEAILGGRLPPDCWVAAPGGSRWLRAIDVPVIQRIVEGLPTRRRVSGERMATLPSPVAPPKRPRKMDETVFLRGEPEEDTLRTSAPASTEPSPPPTVRSVDRGSSS